MDQLTEPNIIISFSNHISNDSPAPPVTSKDGPLRSTFRGSSAVMVGLTTIELQSPPRGTRLAWVSLSCGPTAPPHATHNAAEGLHCRAGRSPTLAWRARSSAYRPRISMLWADLRSTGGKDGLRTLRYHCASQGIRNQQVVSSSLIIGSRWNKAKGGWRRSAALWLSGSDESKLVSDID